MANKVLIHAVQLNRLVSPLLQGVFHENCINNSLEPYVRINSRPFRDTG